MAEDRSPVHFDETARTVIRDALNRYRKEHGIGAPRLRERIMKTDPQRRELPISTLQRFLRGTHRTDDMYVGMIETFLTREGVALKADDTVAELDEVALLGHALTSFTTGDGITSALPAFREALPGHYTRTEKAAAPLDLTIEPIEDQSFMRVSGAEQLEGGAARQSYEGVLNTHGALAHLVLRNKITYQLRTYWLERIETQEGYRERYLSGDMVEPMFRRLSSQNGVINRERVLLVSKED